RAAQCSSRSFSEMPARGGQPVLHEPPVFLGEGSAAGKVDEAVVGVTPVVVLLRPVTNRIGFWLVRESLDGSFGFRPNRLEHVCLQLSGGRQPCVSPLIIYLAAAIAFPSSSSKTAAALAGCFTACAAVALTGSPTLMTATMPIA